MDWIREYGWFFFIYALLGWCGEVAFAAVKEKHFVNRGFLNGPLCPIYGVGVVAIVGLGLIAGDNVFVLFVISAIVTSLIELVTGYVLEKLFHTRWWDYSDMPLNIGGYICLPFSLLWGAACVVIIKVIHPLIATFVDWIPLWLSWPFLVLFTILLVIDLYVTVSHISKNLRQLQRLEELAIQLREFSDTLGKKISDTTLEAERRADLDNLEEKKKEFTLRKAEMESLMKEKMPGLRRHLKAFPKLQSKRFKESLEKFRENLYGQDKK